MLHLKKGFSLEQLLYNGGFYKISSIAFLNGENLQCLNHYFLRFKWRCYNNQNMQLKGVFTIVYSIVVMIIRTRSLNAVSASVALRDTKRVANIS